MDDTTIVTDSPVGQHLGAIGESKQASYLMFNKKKIELVAKITIGRDSSNDIVVDNKLASRHHAMIQKIRDAYFIKDEGSTNGTFVNDIRIPIEKYIKLNSGDKVTIGNSNLVIS
jgi:pSer/pThr/pTyr-binding forkhead associated (FHA) protein